MELNVTFSDFLNLNIKIYADFKSFRIDFVSLNGN